MEDVNMYLRMPKNIFVFGLLFVITGSSLIAANEDSYLWNSYLELGVQQLPNYKEDGTNSGFNKSRPYGKVGIDARWLKDNNDTNSIIFNSGIELSFLGTASINETNASSTELPTVFNDISNTLDANIYFQCIPWHFAPDRIGSEIGFITHVGVRTREKKSSTQDTVDYYGDLGMKYTFFRKNPYSKNNSSANVLPDGYIGIYQRYYSDYNAYSNHWRTILDFQYKLMKNSSFLLGVKANLGQHEDEIFLTLSVRNNIETLFRFFGQEEYK